MHKAIPSVTGQENSEEEILTPEMAEASRMFAEGIKLQDELRKKGEAKRAQQEQKKK